MFVQLQKFLSCVVIAEQIKLGSLQSSLLIYKMTLHTDQVKQLCFKPDYLRTSILIKSQSQTSCAYREMSYWLHVVQGQLCHRYQESKSVRLTSVLSSLFLKQIHITHSLQKFFLRKLIPKFQVVAMQVYRYILEYGASNQQS